MTATQEGRPLATGSEARTTGNGCGGGGAAEAEEEDEAPSLCWKNEQRTSASTTSFI